MRALAYPLITINPYFSIWSMSDALNQFITKHWSGNDQPILGYSDIDGITYCFMGNTQSKSIQSMKQIAIDISLFSTEYTFEMAGARLKAKFTSPLLNEFIKFIEPLWLFYDKSPRIPMTDYYSTTSLQSGQFGIARWRFMDKTFI